MESTAHVGDGVHTSATPWRLGVVSFLNAKPLIAGLGRDPDVQITYDVPARLPRLLDTGAVDAALVPVVDLTRQARCWPIVSDGCIASDGETLTVRVFSRKAPASIRRLHVDGDSHTSVALATIIWRERYGIDLEIVPLADDPESKREAVLLIGDKVVNHNLIGYDEEIDLGATWKALTTLPFVFAVWAAPKLNNPAALATRLNEARDRGVRSAPTIAAEFGPKMGWSVPEATRYLTAHLQYVLGPKQRQGMETFLELARRHGLVSTHQDPVYA